MFNGPIEEAVIEAEKLLSSIVPGGMCVAQDWDQRIDCLVKLPDGSLVGEMIGVKELTERRIRATGERLKKRVEGIDVPLVNEVRGPRRIVPS